MTDERLASGMTPRQAVDEARDWWQLRGRDIMRKRLVDRDKSKPDGSSEDAELLYRSGIIAGKEWGDLTRQEQHSIVKCHQAEIVSTQGEHNDDQGKINDNSQDRTIH